MKSDISIAYRYPIGLLLLVILITYYIFQPASKIQLNNSIENWLNKDSIVLQEYLDFSSNYDSFGFISLFYKVDNIYSEKSLNFNEKLITRFKRVENVKHVSGLSNTKSVSGRNYSYLLRRYQDSESNIKDDSYNELTKLLIQDNLVSKGLNYTLIKIEVKKNNAIMNYRTMNRVFEVLQEPEFKLINFGITGTIPIYEQVNRLASKQSALYIVFNLAVIVLLMAVFFKSLKYALYGFLTIIVSIIWVLGLFSWFSYTASNITISLLVLILLSTLINTCYIVVKYNRKYTAGIKKQGALIQTIIELYRPCLYSHILATCIFAIYGLSSSISVSSFGYFSVFAILVPCFLSFTMLPALILLFDRNFSKPKIQSQIKLHAISHFMVRYWFLKIYNVADNVTNNGNKKLVQKLLLAIFIICLPGIYFLKIDYNIDNGLSDSNVIKKSYVIVSQHFPGIFPVEVLLTARSENIILNKNYQKKILDLENVFSTIPNVSSVTVAALSKQSLISNNSQTTRMTLYSRWLSSNDLHNLTASIKTKTFELFDENSIELSITGQILLRQFLITQLIEYQAYFVLLSFIVMFLLSYILFKKRIIAIRVTIYPLISLLISLSFIAFFGIKLDVAFILFLSFVLYVILNFIVHQEYQTDLHDSTVAYKHQENDVRKSNFIIYFIAVACCLTLLFSNYGLHYYFSGLFILWLSIFTALYYFMNQKK